MISKNLVGCCLMIVAASSFNVSAKSSGIVINHIDLFASKPMMKTFRMSRFMNVTKREVHLHLVDGVENIEAELGKLLGVDKVKAKNQAQIDKIQYDAGRLYNSKKFIPIRERLKDSVKSFEKAMQLNIKKVPAVVFNGEYVIYGETPLAALTIFNRLNKAGKL